MIWHNFVSAAGLQSLDNYGYHGQDNSVLGHYVLFPFYNWLITFVPLTIAPNLMTFWGMVCNILGYVVVAYYSLDTYTPAPAWTLVATAVLMFIYQTLDNLDGKQARRTGSSSPLGELFDHVADAFSVPLSALVTGIALEMGPWTCFWLLLTGQNAFYLAHWEEYFTGELVLGKFNSPLEAQVTMMGVYLSTAFFGGDMWRYRISLNETISFDAGELLVFTTYTLGIYTCYGNFSNVLSHTKKKGISFVSTLSVVIPYAILLISSFVFVWATPSALESHPHLVVLTIGSVHAYIVGRLILQRVCHESYEVFYYTLLIPIVLALDALARKSGSAMAAALMPTQDTLLWAGCIASLVLFFHMGISIIVQLTTYLNIKCFSIPTPNHLPL